ncbi:hypothetical protein [Gracilimonas sp.]|uniref:hypothetical protein n=1 Tax=Gracilimonas sp. TaxID=1974203 RepID=UPI0028729054|nr:hypothetical protein [Gracilimonas sp.]
MRDILFSILFLLAASFIFPAYSQVTAVMQARVEIISGSGISAIQQPTIDLNNANTLNEINTGGFSLVTAPGTNVQIRIEKGNDIINEFGEAIEFESFIINQLSSDNGEHQVSLTGKLKKLQKLNGQYKGSVTAVVEYL